MESLWAVLTLHVLATTLGLCCPNFLFPSFAGRNLPIYVPWRYMNPTNVMKGVYIRTISTAIFGFLKEPFQRRYYPWINLIMTIMEWYFNEVVSPIQTLIYISIISERWRKATKTTRQHIPQNTKTMPMWINSSS